MFEVEMLDRDAWQRRRDWLRIAQKAEEKQWFELKMSSHSLLLMADIETAFCAGAWLSVIVMSHAAIEATYKEVVAEDYRKTSADLYGMDEELQWLQNVRNQVVHVALPGEPSLIWKLPAQDFLACLAALEPEACRAVTLVYRTFYKSAKGVRGR